MLLWYDENCELIALQDEYGDKYFYVNGLAYSAKNANRAEDKDWVYNLTNYDTGVHSKGDYTLFITLDGDKLIFDENKKCCLIFTITGNIWWVNDEKNPPYLYSKEKCIITTHYQRYVIK